MPDRSVPLLISNRTDLGRVREVNEDYLGYFQAAGKRLFAVADGMGGEVGGREASHSAIEAVQQVFERSAGELEPPALLAEAVMAANRACLRKQAEQPELDGMGTTLELLLIDGDKAWWSHIGDSRIYKISGERHEQLTSDHTVVNRLLRQGMITPEEARDHPQRHVLSRVVGRDEDYQADISPVPVDLAEGEALVLCSDGLSDVVSGEEIARTVSHLGPQKACERLVRLANERGGHDNITVQVIFKGQARQTWDRLTTVMSIDRLAGSPLKVILPWAAMVVAVVGVLAVTLWLWRSAPEEIAGDAASPPAAATAPPATEQQRAAESTRVPAEPETPPGADYALLTFTDFASDDSLSSWASVSLADLEAGGYLRPPASADKKNGSLRIPTIALARPGAGPVLRLRWRPAEMGSSIVFAQGYRGRTTGPEPSPRIVILGISKLDSASDETGDEAGDEATAWQITVKGDEVTVEGAGPTSTTDCVARAEDSFGPFPGQGGAFSVALSADAGMVMRAPAPLQCSFRLPVAAAPEIVDVEVYFDTYLGPDDSPAEQVFLMSPVLHHRFEGDTEQQAVAALKERLRR